VEIMSKFGVSVSYFATRIGDHEEGTTTSRKEWSRWNQKESCSFIHQTKVS